jgi:hypothetical protein
MKADDPAYRSLNICWKPVSSEPLHFPQHANEQSGITNGEPIAAKLFLEESLWRLSREVSSGKSGDLELAVFLIFGVLASVATVLCFYELFSTFCSDVFEQTVRTLLSR